MKILMNGELEDQVLLEDDGCSKVSLILNNIPPADLSLLGFEKGNRFPDVELNRVTPDFKIVREDERHIEYQDLPDGFFDGPCGFFSISNGNVSMWRSKYEWQATLWNSRREEVEEAHTANRAADTKKWMRERKIWKAIEVALITLLIFTCCVTIYQRMKALSPQYDASPTHVRLKESI